MQPVFKKYIATVAIIWAASFIVLLLAYLFIIVPQRQELDQTTAALAAKDWEYKRALSADSNETKTRMRAQLASLSEEFNRYGANIGDISKIAFDIGQTALDLRVLNLSCKGRIDENASSGINTDHLIAMPVNLAFQGTFTQFAKFINMLERHHPVLFVDRFALSHSTTSDIDNPGNMTLSVYLSKFQLSTMPTAAPLIAVGKVTDANASTEPNKPPVQKDVNEPNTTGMQTAMHFGASAR